MGKGIFVKREETRVKDAQEAYKAASRSGADSAELERLQDNITSAKGNLTAAREVEAGD